MTTAAYPISRRAPFLAQAVTAIIIGLILFLGFVLTWVVGYQLWYAGRIFPGVSVAGVPLSGLSPDEAAVKLNAALSYPITGKVVFREADRAWVVAPVQLGMVFDPSASARTAYQLGRGGGLFAALDGQIRARTLGYDISPVIIFDQRVAYQYLRGLAQQVDQPVVEASLKIDGSNVTAISGQPGRLVDLEATLAGLSGQLQKFQDGEVALVVHEAQPALTDVSAEADSARQIVSQPLQVTMPDAQAGDPGPWVFQPEVLAHMIGLEKVEAGGSGQVRVSLSPQILQQMLSGVESQVDRKAADARFHYDDASGQLQPISQSQTGRTLNIGASIKAINDALLRGEHSVPLVVTVTQPQVSDTATAQELGITGLLPDGVQTSYFYGSHAERIQNITTAAGRFDGVLVAPGETFSMGQTLGDVSLDNGFTEALIIYGGHTIKGVGGGVCQVSTTLFRTVFHTGFPVIQRVPHAYRVSYYEETPGGLDPSLAGLDATVYFPLVDFEFKNDSPYWILMETYVDTSSQSLTWKFYSTYDGRTVQWSTTGPQNIVQAPAALFKENSDLSPGQITQTDYAANGADVTVNRTVLMNGAVHFQDQFQTHYEPWQAVCEYAPGMDNPEKNAKRKGICQPPHS
ncbi:MAG TPA: VanW family protein [Anaerolineales bacterium]|nr:VanW family protein [Anaerolineales bacterium]